MSYIESSRNLQISKYPDILSIKDLQNILTVGRSTAYRLINDGSIKHWKVGKSIKIPKVFLIEYIENSCYNGRVVTDSLSQEGG